jgi:DNA adenine methylase
MNYPGGKGGVYQRLINLMPPHEVYIETHLGGGAVIRKKKQANKNIGIEIDPNVIELWTKISNQMDLELIHGDAIHYLESFHFTGSIILYLNMNIPWSNI